jgi:phosphoglycolate phosphatase-like HAD superfamily hydrolase
MVYSEIDQRKQAFIFELDNVLYPEKDYLLQVYYLFASFLEYTEMLDAKAMVKTMTETYEQEGHKAVFDALQKEFSIDIKYAQNFQILLGNAKLPLKLLLYQQMLDLMQEIVVDRKKLFIVTNGNPQQQLNKIRQVEWHGLEQYLICYFANEYASKPEPDAIHTLIQEHNLQRRDILMIGSTKADELSAEASGIDYLDAGNFIKITQK